MKSKLLIIAGFALAAMAAQYANAGDGARAWGSTTSLTPRYEIIDLALKEHMLRNELLGNRTKVTTTQHYYGNFYSTQNCDVEGSCQAQSSQVSNINGSTVTTISSETGSSVNVTSSATATNTSQNGDADTVRGNVSSGTITINQ